MAVVQHIELTGEKDKLSVNGYLSSLGNSAIIRDSEKVAIQRSISTLESRLNSYFPQELKRHFIFGSYSRGTILPRQMDSRSDIDYMIVFKNSGFQPQTYLDKLRKFVQFHYRSSEIRQSNPTIVLSLNHINFELVPAREGFFSGLQIPAKASDYNDWIETDPTGFNDELVKVNSSNKNLIKPLIRLVKYWNAKNDYVFESYDLEKKIVEKGYFLLSAFGSPQLKDYFFDVMASLSVGWLGAQWRKDRIDRAHRLIEEIKDYDNKGINALPEEPLRKLVPPIGALAGGLG